jgi:5-(carboxyamino)imidazole ribonucleotide mutase
MIDILSQCGIKWEFSIISAHRNPEELANYCKEALSRGVKVFIAAAGMAAHLPGAIVSYVKEDSPVIGVPLPSQEYPDAQDALLSMIRMPFGCPIAIPGIGKTGLKNSALLACQILSLVNKEIKNKSKAYLKKTKKAAQIGLMSK